MLASASADQVTLRYRATMITKVQVYSATGATPVKRNNTGVRYKVKRKGPPSQMLQAAK